MGKQLNYWLGLRAATADDAPPPRPRDTVTRAELDRMSDSQMIMYTLGELLDTLGYPYTDLPDALAQRAVAGINDPEIKKGRGR